jgi:hypothetical protein
MACLNITNPTFQNHVFVFRAPEARHNQRHDIPTGATVTVFRGSDADCHQIMEQHYGYGIRKRTEVLSKRSTTATGLLYSVDSYEAKPIDLDALAQIQAQTGELLDDLAAKERELHAMGAAAANVAERRDERSLEVSVAQAADKNNREVRDIQTVQVSRKNSRAK